jgi:magnesium transporter
VNGAGAIEFDAPALKYARTDFPQLRADSSVDAALSEIRRTGVGERVVYFYAVDADRKLLGVVPTRRLLTALPETMVREIMVPKVVALPESATVLEACEFFVLYRFLAFPIVDRERRIVGMVDSEVFTEIVLESEEPKQTSRDDFFEALGFHLAQVRDASPWRIFRYRFPWLMATILAGTVCALLAGKFEVTLAHSLVIAFFLTMVLGLNESVSTQSMSVTIQALRSASFSWKWFRMALRREFVTALLLGFSCGAIVAAIVWIWREDGRAAAVIGGTIGLSLVTACLFGLSVPSFLHRLNLDPKIAAGPITLALSDICALLLYFTGAWIVFA